MKFMKWAQDGGPESTVYGFFFIELKSAFSVALLKFEGKSRDAYHTHAFDCLSWLLSGVLRETHTDAKVDWHWPSWMPFFTWKDTFHKVDSVDTSWVFTLRGPWVDRWFEWLPEEQELKELTHGREETTVQRDR